MAETFLVKDKPRKRTRNQLKQEASQLMGTLIEQASTVLEKQAQIQNKLCVELRSSLEGSRGIINRASLHDLQRLVTNLQGELQRLKQQQVAQSKFLASLK